MNSLRHAVRAMFDDCGDELNIVVARLRDTLAAIAIAILFILSTAAGTVSGGMVRRVLQWSGIASSSLPGILLLELTGFCTGVALNFALFMLLLRVVAHIKAGRFTLIGASSGSLTVSVMQLLGARLLTGASRQSAARTVRGVDRRAGVVQSRRPGHHAVRRPHRGVPTGMLNSRPDHTVGRAHG